MLSVTTLSSYLYCPRKVFLQKVLKLQEPPKPALTLGTIRHEVVENTSENENEIVQQIRSILTLDEIEKAYERTYRKFLTEAIKKHKRQLQQFKLDPLDVFSQALPSLLTQAHQRAQNVYTFQQQTKLVGIDLWEKLTPKIHSEVRIESPQLKLKGIIDQIHYDNEKSTPFELKTGKAPREGVWPGHRIQAAAYAMLLEEKTKKPVEEAVVYYLDINEKRTVTLNPFMKDEITQLVNEVSELLDNYLLPDILEQKNKCTSCGLKTECYQEAKMESMTSSLLQQK